MICVSLAESTFSACLEALKTLDFAEIRMDAMPLLALGDIRTIFSRPVRLIATCRPAGPWGDQDRKTMLITAIESGAAYVDVELESEPGYREEIMAAARAHDCQVVVSFHDYEKTPEKPELETIITSSFKMGADIAKVACMVNSDRDNARLLGLLDEASHRIVVVGMGRRGRIARIAAPLLGSPFTFASLSEGKETAEGQIDKRTLEHILEVVRHK